MGWRELDGFTAPVASYPVNPFGLYAVSGAALKWNHDCLNEIKLLEPHPGTESETIKSIIQPQSPRFIDLRRGVLLTGVSLACVIFAQNMMDPEYRASLLGLSAFPGAIGMIYLMFHFLPKVYLPNQSD